MNPNPDKFHLLMSATTSIATTINGSSRPEVFLKNVFEKYAVNLQENTHAEV